MSGLRHFAQTYSIAGTAVLVGTVNGGVYRAEMSPNLGALTSLSTSVQHQSTNEWIATISSPNPFTDYADIRYTLAHGEILIGAKVYDMLGRDVAQLSTPTANDETNSQSLRWNGRSASNVSVATGVYSCVITTNRGSTVVRLAKQ